MRFRVDKRKLMKMGTLLVGGEMEGERGDHDEAGLKSRRDGIDRNTFGVALQHSNSPEHCSSQTTFINSAKQKLRKLAEIRCTGCSGGNRAKSIVAVFEVADDLLGE